MVEHIVVKPFPQCRRALEIIDLIDIIRATESLLNGIDSISVIGGDKALVVYIWRPDEFTKKRIKTKLAMRRADGRIEIRARGALDMDILVTCTDNGEAAIAVAVYGKGEKYISEEALKRVADKIYETLLDLAG